MIKKFLVPILVSATLMASPVLGSAIADSSSIPSPFNTKTPVKKVIIYGNADIMLVTNGSTEITIDENTVGLNGIKFIYENNSLEIITEEYTTGMKPIIRIPAQQLEKIEINGDAKVYSESVIRSPRLDVFVNGACDLNIRSTGKIVIKASADYQMNFLKNEKIKLEPNLK